MLIFNNAKWNNVNCKWDYAMKKYIVLRLVLLMLVITGILLSFASYAMLQTAHSDFRNEAHKQIKQIEKILAENDNTAKQLQEELKADFLIRAKAAAHMIQYNQDVIYDIERLKHITNLLQIDEIHLFTHEGEIYSGNVPDYYGYTMNSGDQMRFFTPLLSDYSLELAQDITPNTADGKEMQYVAVWSEDRQHIVQIGIEPLRLLEAMKATELSHIFSLLTPSTDTTFFTFDAIRGEIISSTNQAVNGCKLNELGLSAFNTESVGEVQKASIKGVVGYLLLLHQTENIYIGYFQNYHSVYASTLVNIIYLIVISILLAVLVIALIYFFLDRVVLRRLLALGKGIDLIANGNLEHKMNVTGLPEFELLSKNVNYMVKRVVESSRKFSTIFEYLNVPIAMYECRANTVITTGKLAEILQINNDKLKQYSKSPQAFLSFIDRILSNPYSNENDLYILFAHGEERFLKIMRYQEGENEWGLIVDSTDEIVEKNKIKKERDLDFLTGLYGKRAFFEQLDTMAQNPNLIKKAAILMFDLDNLKYVNDTWGHDAGDKFIRAAADVLQKCEYEHKLCSRLSGDEFAMLLYNADDYSQLELYIKQIKEEFSKTSITTPSDTEHKVSTSIGYALYPEQNNSFHTCLSFADKAMYRAKSRQKGSIEKYDPNEHYENEKE